MLEVILLIGSFHYRILHDCNRMGTVEFPLNDRTANRVIIVCDELPANQRKIVAEHELHHICYHNHVHEFKTDAELKAHIDHKYTEEQSAEIVSQCVVETRQEVYDVFGVK